MSYRDGVKTWAVRLAHFETSLHIEGIKFQVRIDDEDSSDEDGDVQMKDDTGAGMREEEEEAEESTTAVATTLTTTAATTAELLMTASAATSSPNIAVVFSIERAAASVAAPALFYPGWWRIVDGSEHGVPGCLR